MIKYVFLDLDDTVLDFGRAEREALSSTLAQMGVIPTPERMERYHEINLAHWRLLEKGEITRERLLVQRFERFYEATGTHADAVRTQAIYEYELGRRSYFLPGAEQMLKELRANGYRLYLASNGTTVVQLPRIKKAGLSPYFEGVFLSEAIGADKPSRAFFDACFAEIEGFDPACAVIVGDSLSSDILGGKNAGIKTCWFNPHGKSGSEEIKPDFEISALCELCPLLRTVL